MGRIRRVLLVVGAVIGALAVSLGLVALGSDARTPDSSFERVAYDSEDTLHLTVLGGALYDASGLTTSTDPGKASIERLDLR